MEVAGGSQINSGPAGTKFGVYCQSRLISTELGHGLESTENCGQEILSL